MNARRSRYGSIFTPLACALTFTGITACGGATQSTTSDGTGTESAALSASTSSEETFQTQAAQCATAFQTCVSAADADIATCKAALEKCLPDVPPPGPGCGLWNDGGVPTPPPPPDGGAAVPPDMGSCGGPHGHGPPPPFCGQIPLPPSPALEACRTTLESCMQAASDDDARKTCIEAAHTCVHDAFEAARAAN